MAQKPHHISASGVEIAADFRDNLIIDRFDPVFAAIRGMKREHLRSANSEDAVTWNVFRSLRQISSSKWLASLFQSCFPTAGVGDFGHAVVTLWQAVSPPPNLLQEAAEGESEIDVMIETPTFVWFIEAKLNSDISLKTAKRAARNQVLRNIDVGSYYAGVKQFFFSLLVSSAAKSPSGVEIVKEYADLDRPRALLAAHRPDGLPNLRGVSLLTWKSIADTVKQLTARVDGEESIEEGYAERLSAWLRKRRIGVS